jgi:hypothetical protein
VAFVSCWLILWEAWNGRESPSAASRSDPRRTVNDWPPGLPPLYAFQLG